MAPALDVLIVGGGPVGAALAALLAEGRLRTGLIEAREVDATDPRSIALSYGSALILQRLGAWTHARACTPIESVHVSQAGGWGRTLITAHEQDVPALGYVCHYGALHAALAQPLRAIPQVDVRTGTRAVALASQTDRVEVELASAAGAGRLDARLVVLADGGQISAGLVDHDDRDYRQCAVIAEVECDLPHAGRAYERFSPQGPIALLPCGSGYALVWTVVAEVAEPLAALPDAAFLDALQRAFGDRAGRLLRCGPRSVFPLRLRVAHAPRASRVVLLGNAAQTLHPVAGQGLNLGLRDAQALAALVLATPDALHDPDLARRFHAVRRSDRLGTVGITDSLVRLFSNEFAPLRAVRGCGLTLLDLVPPAKRMFAQRMMFGG